MKKIILSTIILSVLFIASAWASPVFAQAYKLELVNPSGTIGVGDSFQAKILINTAGEQAINGDALVIFEPDKVSIDNAESGNFFTYFTSTPLFGVPNKYLVSSWEESIAHAKSSSTDTLFATLSLTAKLAGETTLSFDCTAGTEADSNINRASDSTDIIVCSKNKSLTFNIGQATGPTSPPGTSPTSVPPTLTPRPTATLIPTAVPTAIPPTLTTAPPPLPRSGNVGITFIAAGIGVLLTTVGVLSIL